MESYIPISKLNDYIFCPRSVYLKTMYDNFMPATHHRTPQAAGKIVHEAIDEGRYSSAKRYLQGIDVYSEKYKLAGKIDVYDRQTCALIERKRTIKHVYDGYRYQLYAQYFCLREMGYEVTALFLHSLTDNRRYAVDLPAGENLVKFEALIAGIHTAVATIPSIIENEKKCATCIYKPLCH